MYRHTFNNVVFSTKTLGYFRVEESNKRESTERLRDEHICNFPKL
jgi:hypothetical protein